MNAAYLERREAGAMDGRGYVRGGFARQPVRAIVTNILPAAVGTGAPDLLERGCIHAKSGTTIGVPWVMVLLHAMALIGSSMAGLAVALFVP